MAEEAEMEERESRISLGERGGKKDAQRTDRLCW